MIHLRTGGNRLGMTLQKSLIIRFGSLGDLCLLAWTLQRLRARSAPQRREITLVTKAAFGPLLAHAEGVDRVITLEGSQLADVSRLADRLGSESWDEVIDAHSVSRSRLLTVMLGHSVQARLRKDTWARLRLLWFRRDSAPLQRSMHDRFAELFTTDPKNGDLPDPVRPPLSTWLDERGAGPGAEACLGLAPGAQWDTKRWPADSFALWLKQFRLADPLPVRIFLGPREQRWFEASSLATVAATTPDVEIVEQTSLEEVAAGLAGCRLLVTNDSGLLHVAEAAGVPVLALFGPTVRQFGYFPCLPQSRVLQRDLDCRPCSRNGKRDCHRGDLACLNEIEVDQVLAATRDLLADIDRDQTKGPS